MIVRCAPVSHIMSIPFISSAIGSSSSPGYSRDSIGALIYCECDLDWRLWDRGGIKTIGLSASTRASSAVLIAAFHEVCARLLIRNICIEGQVLGFSSQLFILESYVPLIINVADTWLKRSLMITKSSLYCQFMELATRR